MTGEFMVDRIDRTVRSEADMMAMWVERRVRCLGFVGFTRKLSKLSMSEASALVLMDCCRSNGQGTLLAVDRTKVANFA